MSQRLKFRVALIALFAPIALPLAPLLAQEAATAATTAPATTQAAAAGETRFLRFVGDGKSGGRLETSDVTFKNDAGVSVRLVSAVHIGESSYFQEIQKSFAGCDAVLYEMVKDKDAPPPVKGQQSDHAVARLQRFLKETLNLSYQLDEIDYTPRNFVHADMDAAEFERLRSERGESFPVMMLQAMMRSMSDPGAMRAYADEPADVMDLMTRPDGESQIKLLLARRLGDIEREASGMDMLNGTVILTERNKAVTRVLKETLKQGKRNVAIFYGAAHMEELADRLDLMGFHPVSTDWRPAWNVRIRQDAPSAFMKLMGQVEKQLK